MSVKLDGESCWPSHAVHGVFPVRTGDALRESDIAKVRRGWAESDAAAQRHEGVDAGQHQQHADDGEAHPPESRTPRTTIFVSLDGRLLLVSGLVAVAHRKARSARARVLPNTQTFALFELDAR